MYSTSESSTLLHAIPPLKGLGTRLAMPLMNDLYALYVMLAL